MYCHASPSFGTKRCTIASVAGSPPSLWYSSAPGHRRRVGVAGPLAEVAAELEVGVDPVLHPAEQLQDQALAEDAPTCCSARRGRPRARAARRRRARARSAGGRAAREPAAVDALQAAAAADGVEQGAADVGVDQGLGEHGGVVAAPDARDHAARGVGLQVLGALALDQRERDGVGLGLALGVLDPRRSARGRRAGVRGPASGSASTTETPRMRRALPANQRRPGRKRASARSSSPPAAPGDERVDRAARLDDRGAEPSSASLRPRRALSMASQ